MIISFAKTTEALLAGAKTVTRREWSDRHAQKVIADFKAGKTFDAWNYSPRVKVHSPHKVATIRMTEEPVLESSISIGNQGPNHRDFGAEGFRWMEANGLAAEVSAILTDWWEKPRNLWVVRFELVEVMV